MNYWLQTYSENIYDEPSIPDPIYQEVTKSMSTEQEIQTMKNYSYATVRSKECSMIILNECPAYISHNTCSESDTTWIIMRSSSVQSIWAWSVLSRVHEREEKRVSIIIVIAYKHSFWSTKVMYQTYFCEAIVITLCQAVVY